MYLKQIRIEQGECVNVKSNDFTFRCTAHHVKEIFMALLPLKYRLDGSSLLQITCGLRGDKALYYKWNDFGSSEYFVEDFDFDNYRNSSPKEREVIILELIRFVLINIAQENNSEMEILNRTLLAVKNSNFYLKTKIQKLCKKHSLSKLRLNVNRILSKENGEMWNLEIYDGKILKYQDNITKNQGCVDYRNEFSKAEWRHDNIFAITNKLNKDKFLFDLNNFQSLAVRKVKDY